MRSNKLVLFFLLGALLPGIECRNCTCGTRSIVPDVSKIIGGVRVREGEFPWRVALFEKSAKGKKGLRFFCGGTLIAKDVILTAAHCVVDRSRPGRDREMYAGIGHTDIGDLSKENLTRIARILPHERFSDMLGLFSSYRNDIALLFLESPVEFSDTVTPACLPFAFGTELSNSTVTATGWGTNLKDEGINSYMYAVDLHSYTASECRRKFFTVSLLISNNVFCAYELAKDTCKGDSGGGVDLLVNGRMFSVGIVSWGWGCARRGAPGIYTKVADYLDWIVTNSPSTPKIFMSILLFMIAMNILIFSGSTYCDLL